MPIKIIKGKETQRAEITRSRSKKKPFKLMLISENGEPLMNAQLLTTRKNCIKNLLSIIRMFNGKHVIVLDLSGRAVRQFYLLSDGYEEEMDVMGM